METLPFLFVKYKQDSTDQNGLGMDDVKKMWKELLEEV
jgi:hypothetical protein